MTWSVVDVQQHNWRSTNLCVGAMGMTSSRPTAMTADKSLQYLSSARPSPYCPLPQDMSNCACIWIHSDEATLVNPHTFGHLIITPLAPIRQQSASTLPSQQHTPS